MQNNKSGVFVRNGTIYVQGSIDGKYYRKSTGKKDTKANLTWVKKNAHDVLLNIIGKAEDKEKEIVFEDFAYKSLEINSPNRKQSTNTDYLASLKRHILPHFSKWLLNEIKPSDIKAWQSKLHNLGLSGKRIKDIRTVFRGVLQDAYVDEIINENPFNRVKAPKVIKPEIRPFNLEEVQHLVNEADGWFKNYLTIAFFTGLRIGEMLGLRWEDINFKSGYMSIKRAISEGIISTPKTENSIREIDILEPVLEALKKQYKDTGLLNGYVFLTSRKEYFHDTKSIAPNQWRPLLQRSGIDYRNLYQTRHTFASIMLQQGEEVGWISKMMGHTDIHTTLTKYTRFVPRREQKRAVFLNDINFKIG